MLGRNCGTGRERGRVQYEKNDICFNKQRTVPGCARAGKSSMPIFDEVSHKHRHPDEKIVNNL